MIEFFRDAIEYPFLQYSILAALLASIACGVVGSFVVVRRMTYVAGAIAHSVLGGLGATVYLNRVHGVNFITPLAGAAIGAVVAAMIVAWLTLRGREREDTVLSAVWAVGMALGLAFISASPGYQTDLMSYLFGNILLVGKTDLIVIGILDVAVVIFTLLFNEKLVAIGFDEEFSRLRGVRVELYQFMLLVMTALAVVMLVRVVGIVLAIALLTLPAATALHVFKRFHTAMFAAVGICALTTVGGLAVSYEPDWPAGATIVLLAGGIYIGVRIAVRLLRKA